MERSDDRVMHYDRPATGVGPLLLMWLGVHLLVSAFAGLSVDEAHYALYAAHPAWSYHDHPPLVGWVQWPAVLLGGHTFALRVVPVAAWTATALLVHRLTLDFARDAAPGATQPCFDRLAARGAVAMFLAGVMPHLLGIALVPDTLLLPIALGLLWQTWRMSGAGAPPVGLPTARDWLVLGALLGMAGLAKYTAVLLVPGVAWILLRSHGIRMLCTTGPWLATALALLLVAPVFLWNLANDWRSFTYQFAHGQGSDPWQARRFVVHLVVQIVLYGLLPILGCAYALARLREERARAAARLCLAFAAPPLLVASALAGGSQALPHWTAPGWVCLLPLAGLGWPLLQARWPRTCAVTLAVQAVLCLAMLAGAITGIPANPAADLHGWDAAGRRAVTLSAANAVPRLAVGNWTLASRLAWHARPLPVQVIHGRDDQFAIWFGRLRDGDDAIVVDWSRHPLATPQAGHDPRGGFATCMPLDRLPVVVLGREIAAFDYRLCRTWQSAQPQVGGHRR